MDQYPTEEEEYELLYQEEMEMIDDIPEEQLMNEVDQVLNNEPQPCCSKSITQATENDDFFPDSPQLSQISGTAVNRRLFGTPTGAKRAFSTPVAKRMAPIEEIVLPPDVQEELQNIGLSKKRRLERDLFGDIDDLDGNITYVDQEAKKKKLDEDRDREMIQKVLEARKLHQAMSNALKKPKVSQLDAIHDFKMRNLSYHVPQWPFIPLQRSDHERVYVRYHSMDYETKHINDINVFSKGYRGLLGESKEDIWNDAREMVVRRMTTSSTQQAINPPRAIDVPEQGLVGSSNLWVEKYKPKKYFDLLSDEGTNRNLLYWLKMWDKVVFGKEFKPREEKEDTKGLRNFNKQTGKFELKGGWKKTRKSNLNTNVDPLGRPMQKIALLCGPPGLGKTTLAHTIATHAGYQVREVNASDDRSPDAFQMALENGTQMTSVLNTDKRPNCIILDEIDGAPRQSIEFLIRFISDNVVAKASKKGAKTQKNVLRRPIICICNDLYEPALRQLRQVAFVVTFPPIASPRLAERLMEIARKERIKTDFGTLISLAEKSGNDVRSCISTMQFFNAMKKGITLSDVLNSNFGLKDRHRGLFDVWGSIFKIQRPQKQLDAKGAADGGPLVSMTDMSQSTRVKHILQVVHSGGDYNILMQGVYENYLQQKMPDPYLNGVTEATKWFCFSDTVQQHIQHLQNYTVYPYLQYGFVVWHLLFATLAYPNVSFPMRGHEFNQKTTLQKQLFQSFRKGICCGSVGIGQGKVILVETVPMLKRILSPKMRTVAVQLLSEKEKEEFTHTINIMVDLGLTYTQVRISEGTYNYQVEPDLDTLAQFPGCPGIQVNYLGKQLISREIEMARMRRSVPKAIAGTQKNKNAENGEKTTKTAESIAKDTQTAFLERINPKWIADKKPKKVKKIPKDFFGRVIVKTAEVLAKEAELDPVVKSPIWFKYKLGFTNAVRKDVTINDLL
ncbi:chromosome transmission fidelity protein 18 homolog [Episyrphus balteatus]|uniref:chromosome transmission fidelity protein 18 homolog n=1 Tax=Episyrphus balteatus TaxID=286459 RepID=UPI0024866AD9|nr:chromosome transmission fidelity protein 18 homolog [Episyrphus balteatus]